MSEQILKALMELFAIIARPESDASDRRTVVGSFLKRMLNQELVNDYLKVFDEYYFKHQTLHVERGAKRIGPDSVKILKFCDQINKELTQQQKIIVLVRLFEFVNSDDDEITDQEFEFISVVSGSFYIEDAEYNGIKEFTINPFDSIPNSSDILIIDNNRKLSGNKNKHIYSEFLEGQLRVLHITTANMYLMRYIGENEMYLNGQLLQEEKVHVLYTGSSIRNHHIKPIYFSDIVSVYRDERLKSRIVFDIKDICYQFKNGKYGLNKLSFIEESGRLVGIMGASGAGKSTLLNVLNGSAKPTTGEILINGINIHEEKDKVEGLIGHVSQDDLLIEELTVYQNLYYNAKLCFDNYSESEIRNAVNKVLQNLGLYEIKNVQVGTPLNKKISGGQRKRLNIALELIREPAILFLDEPTSGLSSRDSENIMDLLKDLTLKGKLVFVVIHQPSSDIFKMFDQLLILDSGGYLIYNGDPIDSLIYFKSREHRADWSESECHECGNVNPEQIFNIVESLVVDEYGKLTETRKISPKEWHDYYLEYSEKKERKLTAPKELPSISFKIPNKLKQFFVFTFRDILSKLSNTQYLIITFLEAPVLAFILAFIIKYRDVSETNELGYTFIGNSNLPVYIFMSVIVAIFIGLTLSAEEIIKDRKILKREAFLDLSRSSYLFSKAAVMFIISAIQALTFVVIGNSIMEIKGMYLHYWLILFSAWASSNIMGLLISDSFKTVVTIYILIPFLVIPQIILSGVMVKYEKLNPSISSPGSIPVYGELMTARWGFEALSVHQFMENDYQKQFYDFNKKMSIAEFKKNYWVKNLTNKVDFLEKYYDNSKYYKKIQSHLQLLRNEINKEQENNKFVKFDYIDSLYYNKLSDSVIEQTRNYLNKINRLYIRVYNKVSDSRDKIISDLQKTPEDKQRFIQLKRDYHNDKLAEFAENSNEIVRIIEYKGHLYQKIDPVYLDPEHKFVKAHFYSPRKKVFGNYYSTFWVNICVIWIMTLLLYILLYYRGLKRFLDFMEHFSGKSKRT